MFRTVPLSTQVEACKRNEPNVVQYQSSGYSTNDDDNDDDNSSLPNYEESI